MVKRRTGVAQFQVIAPGYSNALAPAAALSDTLRLVRSLLRAGDYTELRILRVKA